MDCIQKRALVEAGDLLKVNAGLFVVRQFLARVVPTDFEWSFLVCENGEVVVAWARKSQRVCYQNEIRARTVRDAVKEVARLDWGSERINARVLGDGRAMQ